MPSGYVDERIVEMQIDNRQFISGAEKTMSVLDKLKKSLSFKDAGDGFSDLQRSADKIDFSGMASAVESISSRFTTLGLVGMRVIQNLTDSVTRFVTNTVKGLTIGPISEGFSKYEQIARYTATIMGATRNEVGMWGDGKQFATQLDYVKNGLETLTWYADETSAAMTDMVANVGKFTNAGVKFENAVVEMMGVTNWGYQAGADKAEQARAMYNLSQAIASGSVRLMDWRSIENANMATIEFKDTVLETAAAENKLTKTVDKSGKTIYKTLKGTVVTAQNFSQTLSEGWFTGDVLQKTLIKYGEYSRRLNSVLKDTGMGKYGMTAAEVIEWTDAIADGSKSIEDWRASLVETMGDAAPSIDQLSYTLELLNDKSMELGKRAFLAGQEYKTFADAIDATKDAVSSGWMTTFQLIIGDAEEAKEVWSAVGEELLSIFNSGAARRNAILGFWRDPSTFDTPAYKNLVSGRESLLNAFVTLYKGIRTFIDPIIDAFKSVFSFFDDKKVEESAAKLIELTQRFEKWTEKVRLSEGAMAGLRVIFTKIFSAIKNTAAAFSPLTKAIGKAIGYIKQFVEVFLFSFSSGAFNKLKFHANFLLLFNKIKKDARSAKAAILSFISGFQELPAVSRVLDKLDELFLKFTKRFSKDGEGTTFRDWIKSFSLPIDTIKSWLNLQNIWAKIQTGFNSLRTVFANVKNTISSVITYIQKAFGKVKTWITNLFSGDGIGAGNILKVLGGILVFFKGKSMIGGVTEFFKALNPIKNALNSFSEFLDGAGEAMENFTKKSPAGDIKTVAIAIGILAASIVVLASVDADKVGKALLVLGGAMAELVGAIAGLNLLSGKKSKNVTKGLINLAASVLILSLAFKVLDGLSVESMMNSLGAIFGILAILVVFLETINLLKIKPKAIKGVTSLAIAMLIFSGVIYILGRMKYNTLVQGLKALAIALIVVSAAMVVLSKFGGGKALAAGAGMLLLATSLIVLAGAIALFALIDPEKMAYALLGMAAALIVIAVAVALLPASLPIIAAGMLIMVVAITLLMAVLAALTLMDPQKLFTSLIIVAAAMVILAAASALMQGCLVGALALLAASVALVIAAAGLVVFAIALRMLVDLPFADLFIGLTMVGAGLIVLAAGLALMTVGIVGAVVLAIAAGGLIALAFALNMFTGLDLPSIAGGLSLLGLAFIPLGIGGILMIAGAPGIIAASVAIGLMGIALIPFVYALKQFADIPFVTYIEYLGLLGGTAAVLALLTPVLGPLSIAIAAFGVACLAAGEGLNLAGDGMVKIADSINNIPENAKTALKDVVKAIGEIVLDVKPAGKDLVKAVNDVGEDVVKAIVDDGKAANDTFAKVIEAHVKLFSDSYTSFNTIGQNIDIGIANGIYDGSSDVITAMSDLAKSMIIQFKLEFGIFSPSRVMADMASYIPLGAAEGIDSNVGVAVDATESMAFKMADAVKGALATVEAMSVDDFSLHPTITPVVDMTNVDSAANSVNSMFSGNLSGRMSQVSRNMSTLDSTARNMNSLSESRANVSQDTYEINIYPQPGMDEAAIADAVIIRLNSGIMRKGVALG